MPILMNATYKVPGELPVSTPLTDHESSDSSPIICSPFLSVLPFGGERHLFSVIWAHPSQIDRETYQIQPHPLKLVVMQRVIPDDPDGSPQNPRLGAVYLNLAEYIAKGSVERKYLLKESKINAVLKVRIVIVVFLPENPN
jgi:hypothetical protein